MDGIFRKRKDQRYTWGRMEKGGVSSAVTDLDQKYLLQNQSQRHQYFIIGEPAGRCATLPSQCFPPLSLSLLCCSYCRIQETLKKSYFPRFCLYLHYKHYIMLCFACWQWETSVSLSGISSSSIILHVVLYFFRLFHRKWKNIVLITTQRLINSKFMKTHLWEAAMLHHHTLVEMDIA